MGLLLCPLPLKCVNLGNTQYANHLIYNLSFIILYDNYCLYKHLPNFVSVNFSCKPFHWFFRTIQNGKKTENINNFGMALPIDLI